MQVDLYEEELLLLSLLVRSEILQSERADIHNQMIEYRLFLHFLREKLLSNLSLEALDESRVKNIS